MQEGQASMPAEYSLVGMIALALGVEIKAVIRALDGSVVVVVVMVGIVSEE